MSVTETSATIMEVDGTVTGLYHYTSPLAARSIELEVLDASADHFVYTTTTGTLTSAQAQSSVALNPANGPFTAIFKLDLEGLSEAGISPIAGPRLVMENGFGPGGGTEVLFGEQIGQQFLIQIQ